MQVDPSVVTAIAELAQLQLEEEDLQENIDSMSNILALVDQMQSVDTSAIEPMANPLDAVQTLRPDEVTEPDRREAFQSIAPATEAGFYLVPKVIE
ncbi:MAG: Asp-tRNA(Asn)/Glu-tRNA(Gln) amidotransferase subunit GatC [Pseudomonadales bacterium]|jgi:aspartyl-tRNA(Asn)/glutamyl-tRNA(Gln) amidotransferase subunit C|nr:Asp-tRNA(Asn)/Glu-tRNA(Gln) amidotransferase subunit GatC [Pseudomonadales bacterium]MDP7145007.1 Asp-tRNA(Asn)/Glu-tRNA(Gln) amidotransferase subunit GatC [Pseudomonadales bacterium]MDP7357189.1 Asp-tRNA(Asn)/Glu-tRNA(Gln) amidotransferase subunit GatC [Pseudomonadales bacterium]MDP7594748.1 Asp-tRNA(Asn)/Glu-tRNA(Gln) amidotransferase subunit GatC [Pseudomonadales bacterium]HJN50073.1 Asp-tRNA(Asn)/Glu-tRNA(Gln) amidotransferase subunit GatC [Pseudomonadales bacterium]|tara:strand:- start:123 stop:410 length:288 start_codon:yes stop_codon:yes gene_type:complete